MFAVRAAGTAVCQQPGEGHRPGAAGRGCLLRLPRPAPPPGLKVRKPHPPCGARLSLFLSELNDALCVARPRSVIPLSTDLGFHLLAIVAAASVSIGVHSLCGHVLISLGHTEWNCKVG